MDDRFAADEEEVADVVFDADIDDVFGFLEGDAAALLGIEAIDSEAAKVAFGVADIGDGELEVAGAAVVEDVFDELKGAGFWARNGTGKGFFDPGRCGWGGGSTQCGRIHVGKRVYCRRKLRILAIL